MIKSEGSRKDLLPVSVIIVTRGKLPHFKQCLKYLEWFSEVHVVHSTTLDNDGSELRFTCAKNNSYHYHAFNWNGKYPKKRQWCLDNLPLKNDWIFMLDADEVLSEELVKELQKNRIFEEADYAGCFIRGSYVVGDQILSYGLKNNKLSLFRKSQFYYPEVDDLNDTEMGEIEGHYQPVLKRQNSSCMKIIQLNASLYHHAFKCQEDYSLRHEKYALWEARMIHNKAYPDDPLVWRQRVKSIFRKLPLRAEISFLHSYILRFGFLDGRGGFILAKARYDYYKKVSKILYGLK